MIVVNTIWLRGIELFRILVYYDTTNRYLIVLTYYSVNVKIMYYYVDFCVVIAHISIKSSKIIL